MATKKKRVTRRRFLEQVGLAGGSAALYESAIERYTEALAYFRGEDVRAEVWRVSGLLAQSLFRSPLAGAEQSGDPARGISAALGVLEDAYALYNPVRRRFVPAPAERPAGGDQPNHSPDKTSALCVFLAYYGRQPAASWAWADEAASDRRSRVTRIFMERFYAQRRDRAFVRCSSF